MLKELSAEVEAGEFTALILPRRSEIAAAVYLHSTMTTPQLMRNHQRSHRFDIGPVRRYQTLQALLNCTRRTLTQPRSNRA